MSLPVQRTGVTKKAAGTHLHGCSEPADEAIAILPRIQ